MEVVCRDLAEAAHANLKCHLYLGGEGTQHLVGGEVDAVERHFDRLLRIDVHGQGHLDGGGDELDAFVGLQHEVAVDRVGHLVHPEVLRIGHGDGVQDVGGGVDHYRVWLEQGVGEVVLPSGLYLALQPDGHALGGTRGVDILQRVGLDGEQLGGRFELAGYLLGEVRGEDLHLAVVALGCLEVDADGIEALAQHVVEQGSALVLDADVQLGDRLGGDDHVVGHVAQADGDGELCLVVVVQRLEQPESARHEEEEQKNEELPALLAEQEVLQLSLHPQIGWFDVLKVEHIHVAVTCHCVTPLWGLLVVIWLAPVRW